MDNTLDTIIGRAVALRETDPETPMPFSVIAVQLNTEFPGYDFTKDQVQKWYKKARPTEDKPPSIEDIKRFFRSHISAHNVPAQSNPTTYRKVVVVADIHGCPDPKLTDMIIQENPDIIVFGGDLLDNRVASRHAYNRNDRYMGAREEANVVRAWVELLIENTAALGIVIEGNHDNWIERLFADLVPHELMFLVKNVLEFMLAGIPRVEIAAMPISANLPSGASWDLGVTRYMTLVGDALISHADFTGKKPGNSVDKLRQWLFDWRRVLDWPELSLIIQTHTHKASIAHYESGFLVAVEPGVGGTPEIDRYKVGYQAKWSPSPIGACVFEQENTGGDWLTLRSSVRLLSPYR